MNENRRQGNLRNIFDTRGSVLAAWFIAVIVIWPILCACVAIVCLLCVSSILATLDPGLEGPAIGMIMSFVYLPPVLAALAVVTAIACYKICRYLTASWRESKPFAFETGTLMAVSIAVAVSFAFWKYLAALMAVP